MLLLKVAKITTNLTNSFFLSDWVQVGIEVYIPHRKCQVKPHSSPWFLAACHCVKSFCIWSYSGLHFPTFGLNTERYGVSLRIQSECGRMQTRMTPNTETFHAVCATVVAHRKHFFSFVPI